MAATPQPSSLPVRALGRYRVIERIGQGGTAEVFRGVLPGMAGFEKKVVLKRLHPRLHGDVRYENLFVTEAKRSAAAHHPHLIETYELLRDESDGHLFMVMEHVDGLDLRRLLLGTDAALPAPVAIWMVVKVLDALEHLAQLGGAHPLVHCDVTPENVLLSLQGDVKLCDLGMATDGDPANDPFPGQVRGKVPYMSPEQTRAEALDGRSDVFSAATVLWECLSGRRLFAAPTLSKIAALVRGGPRPALRHEIPGVPESVDRLLARALDPDRNQRPIDARAFRDELLEILAALAPTTSDTELRGWLGRLVRTATTPTSTPKAVSARVGPPPTRVGATNVLPDTSTPMSPPPNGVDVSPFSDASDPVTSPPCRSVASTSQDASRPVVPPPGRSEVSPSSDVPNPPGPPPGGSGVSNHSESSMPHRIPMPGRPANVETHEIVRAPGGWTVRNHHKGPEVWVRGGRSIWGPFGPDAAVTRLERVPPGALSRVSLSTDRVNWQPLPELFETLGFELLPEAMRVPDARLSVSLRTHSIVSVFGYLSRTRATGRIVAVREGADGAETRQLYIEDGQLVGAQSNRASLRLAVASLTNPVEGDNRTAEIERDIDDLLVWEQGHIYFEPGPANGAPAVLGLTWMLPQRVAQGCTYDTLRRRLAMCWDEPLYRAPNFDARVARMGLLEWQEACLAFFGDGFTLPESMVQQSEGRDLEFALALAHVLVDLGLLVGKHGHPVTSGAIGFIGAG